MSNPRPLIFTTAVYAVMATVPLAMYVWWKEQLKCKDCGNSQQRSK